MTKELAAYNAWKRSTLDRMASKYRRAFAKIIARHLQSYQNRILEALVNETDLPDFDDHKIELEVLELFEKHMSDVVRVGVSDGIREVTPEQKLSTWMQFPYNYPVEDTFIELKEKQGRDKMVNSIYRRISKKFPKLRRRLVRDAIGSYRKNLIDVFKIAAREYYEDEDTEATSDTVRSVISRVFQKSDNQAEMIFRTETTRYFNEARVGYFRHNTVVDFVRIVAITDGRTSDICESRDNYVVPISKADQKIYKPPFHPNCRSVQSPLITSVSRHADIVEKNLGIEFGTIESQTSGKTFKGKRAEPNVDLPRGWA